MGAWRSVWVILHYAFVGCVFISPQIARTTTTLLFYFHIPSVIFSSWNECYMEIQSPSLCLFQILWRPQTLLLLFQLPWIPLLRQLIGGNNKLYSIKAPTKICLQTEDLRVSLYPFSHANTATNIHINSNWCTRRGFKCWVSEQNRDQCNLLQQSPKPQSPSSYPSGGDKMCEIHSAIN